MKSKIPERNKKFTTVTKRNRLNQAKQNSEEVIKSLINVTSIKIETVPDKEISLNHLKEKSRERKRNNTNHDKRQC